MWKQLKLSTKVIVIVVSTVILILASLSFLIIQKSTNTLSQQINKNTYYFSFSLYKLS